MVEVDKAKRPNYPPFKFEPYNPGPDYSHYLRKFNIKRNAELVERLADKDNLFTNEEECLEVCDEVDSHGGKVPLPEEINISTLKDIGVFPSNELITIEVDYVTRRNPVQGVNEHGGTYVARVCAEHASSIPRWGIKEIRQIEDDYHMEISDDVFPGKVYKAFGLPESPFQE